MRRVRQVMTVDDQTGEVKNMETVYVSKVKSEPPYIKVYMDGIDGLYLVLHYSWRVLLWMLKRMPYAGNEMQWVEFGATVRRKAAAELGMSIGRINHAVVDLVTAGVLLRTEKGTYQINPVVFGRGEWKEIAKLRGITRRNESEEKNPAKIG